MIVAVLMGRKGSKGLPGKNLYEVLGRPIAYYPMKTAKMCPEINRVYLSTDDEKLMELAEENDIEVIKRPPELCTDKTLGEDVYVHAYNYVKNNQKKQKIEIIVLLMCNAATITKETISKGIKVLRENPKYDSCVTVSKYNMWSPLRARKIDKDGLLRPFVPFEAFGDPKTLNCDRDSQGDIWFADMGVSIVRPRCLENIENGLLPQKWMGQKIYPLKQWGGLDIDYEWQISQVEYWLQKHRGPRRVIRIKEDEIRKRDIFNKYLQLVEKDVREFFDFTSFVRINCPACNSGDNILEFEKLGFKYVSCKNCSTLFVNPRPPFAVLRRFYSNSPSTSFFVNQFFRPVAKTRRERIFKPRAEYIKEILRQTKELVIGDIGAGFGLFLEELRKILPDNRYIGIEPSKEMASICRSKKLEVKDICLEEVSGMDRVFDLLATFELVEHLFEPVSFFKKVYSLLKPGGHFFFTTLNGKGFDILLLWEKSKSIAPPQHLNFFNPASIRHLLEGLGFEIMEISTPGKLDWDIAEGMIKHENINLGKFWNLLAIDGSQKCKEELQDWIARKNLSSHMRVLVKKPKRGEKNE